MRIVCCLLLAWGALVSVAEAQRYKYEVLSPISSSNEEAVDIAGSDWVLVRDLTSSPPCPVVLNRKSRQTYRLCDAGMREAFAINTRGLVAGYTETSDSHQAAVWSPRGGLRPLPFPRSIDTYSEALDVSDSGVVIGFSGALRNFQCALDDDYDGVADRNDQDEVLTESHQQLVSAAFTWRSGQGSSHIPSINDALISMGTKINNRGDALIVRQRTAAQIPVHTGDSPFLCNFYKIDSLIGPFNVCRVSAQGRETCFKEGYAHQWTDSFACSDADIGEPGGCLHGSAMALNRRGNVLLENRLFHHRTPLRSTGVGFQGRADYGGGAALSAAGDVAGRLDQPFLELAGEGRGIKLTCLAPMNRNLENSSLTGRDIDASGVKVGDFNSRGELLFSSDVHGDGRETQVMIASPLPRSHWGRYRDFCPRVSTEIETHGAYNIVTSLSFRDAFDSYVGLPVTLVAQDGYYDDEYQWYQCAEYTVAQAIIDTRNQAETHLSFVDRRFSYAFKLPPAFEPFDDGGALLTYVDEDDNQCTIF